MFLHIWKGEVFYIKNPAGDILSSLSNLKYSRWRPRWLPVSGKQQLTWELSYFERLLNMRSLVFESRINCT